MEVFLVYLWSIWDNFGLIKFIIFITWGGSTLIVIVITMYLLDNDDTDLKVIQLRSYAAKTFMTTSVLIFLSAFIPNRNQMVLIVSAGALVSIAKNETVQKEVKDAAQQVTSELKDAYSNSKELSGNLVNVLNASLKYLETSLKERK